MCHGERTVSGGLAPDLRASPVPHSEASFRDVLRSRSRRPRGMPSYEQLSDAELEALRPYICQQAEPARASLD